MLLTLDGDLDLSEVARLIAAYSNPHMFLDLRNEDPREIELELEALKNIMEEMIG